MRSTIYDLPFTSKITTDTSFEDKPLAISAKFSNGYGQSAPKGLNNVETKYTIVWTPLERADMLTLRDVLNTVGSWGALRWKAIEDNAIRYYALPPDEVLKASPVSPSQYKCSINVIRVYDVLEDSGSTPIPNVIQETDLYAGLWQLH